MGTSPYSSSFGRLQSISMSFLKPAFLEFFLKASETTEMIKLLESTWYGQEIKKYASVYQGTELLEVALNRHLVEINKISNFIEKIINNGNMGRSIYNIAGSNKKSLWDLFQEMASYKNKRVLKINFKILNRIIPNMIKSILIKNSSILQQIIVIDHTEYKEKKEYL